MSNDITESIIENAQSAKRAKGDNGELEQHALSDQIEVDRYLRNRAAAAAGPRALRFSTVVPPGAV